MQLPPEILSEIFLIASIHSGPHRLTGTRTPIPSTLSFVCQLWRDVAINLPPLWKIITFDSQDDTPINLASVLSIYLKRSRGAPLSIRGTLLNATGTDAPAFNALVLHSQTWRNIHLRLSYALIPLLNTAMHRVPLLEKLSLDVARPTEGPRWLDDDITAFLSAPALHNVSACDLTLRHAFLPSDQIASLTATDTDLRFTLLLAESYTNLTHFALRGWNRPMGFNDTRINLPKLKSLCVVQDRDSYGSPLEHLFELMELPMLEELHVEGWHGSDQSLNWSLGAFTHMVDRRREAPGNFPLTKLSISNVVMDEEDLLLSLLCLPMLETLSIVEGGLGRLEISNLLMQGMTWSPSCALVPRLSALHLAGRLQFSPSYFMALVASRSPLPMSVTAVCDPFALHSPMNAKWNTRPVELNSLSLTLVTGLEKASITMRRLLLLDASLPLRVSLQIRERSEMGQCGYCHAHTDG
ncbi:hypothetical protein C0991_009001 [Blastosporella zonata]|nr:hypothetical protein C0991_009001 [Blastosporella zonata]